MILTTRSFPLWLVHVVDCRDVGLRWEWMRGGVWLPKIRVGFSRVGSVSSREASMPRISRGGHTYQSRKSVRKALEIGAPPGLLATSELEEAGITSFIGA